jgi:hypothetical protein
MIAGKVKRRGVSSSGVMVSTRLAYLAADCLRLHKQMRLISTAPQLRASRSAARADSGILEACHCKLAVCAGHANAAVN